MTSIARVTDEARQNAKQIIEEYLSDLSRRARIVQENPMLLINVKVSRSKR